MANQPIPTNLRGKTITFSPPAGHVIGDAGAVVTPKPRQIWTASDTPLRVVVRNISPNGIGMLISYDSAGLMQDQTAPQNAYVLPAGTSDTFVLLPGESLYAMTPGPVSGMICAIINVAFPFEIKGA